MVLGKRPYLFSNSQNARKYLKSGAEERLFTVRRVSLTVAGVVLLHVAWLYIARCEKIGGDRNVKVPPVEIAKKIIQTVREQFEKAPPIS